MGHYPFLWPPLIPKSNRVSVLLVVPATMVCPHALGSRFSLQSYVPTCPSNLPSTRSRLSLRCFLAPFADLLRSRSLPRVVFKPNECAGVSHWTLLLKHWTLDQILLILKAIRSKFIRLRKTENESKTLILSQIGDFTRVKCVHRASSCE